MKRLIVLPFIILLLCGCSNHKTTTVILNNISFTAKINYDKQEYTCDTTIDEGGIKLIVSEPEQIEGLTLNINKNGITSEFKGISYTPDLNSLPEGAVAQVLFNVLNDVNNKQALKDNQNSKITGKVDDYKYDFYFSPSGLPLFLEIRDLNITVEFNNVILK